MTQANLIKLIENELDQLNLSWSFSLDNSDQFAGLAQTSLQNILARFNEDDLYNIIKSLDSFPAQSFPNNEFGELPYTLVRRDMIFFDVYIWSHFETSIHDHHFCGAFAILKGQSLQHLYSYQAHEKIAEGVDKGELSMVESRKLYPGDTQQIRVADKFIHRVLHLDHPTITICIRTLPLYDQLSVYTINGYRIKYLINHEKLVKVADYMALELALHDAGKIEFNQLDSDMSNLLGNLTHVELLAMSMRYRLPIQAREHGYLLEFCKKNKDLDWINDCVDSVSKEHKKLEKLHYLKILGA
jgi:hypothetical protein